MNTQETPVASVKPTGCCPPFDPTTWDEKEVVWKDKLFVKDHVTSFLHVPLNMGRKVLKIQERIESANAKPSAQLMLSDENSLWGSDIYVEVTKAVAGTRTATLSGTFLTKVFEGPYRNAESWAADMGRYVATKGRTIEKLYFAYTTCPRCAKAYGKNYVVLFARVDAPS